MDEEIGTLMALKIFQVHKELSFPGGGLCNIIWQHRIFSCHCGKVLVETIKSCAA